MKRVEVKEGERYGRLIIIREVEPAGSSHKRVRRFLCRCDCGYSYKEEVNDLLKESRNGGTDLKLEE